MEKLMPLVYDEMHRLAQRYMSGERPGHTLQATALVNEAYLRLKGCVSSDWECRAAFFAMCAQIMRRILVDWARSNRSQKRGNAVPALELKEGLAVPNQSDADLIAIDDALQALAAVDERKSRIVELRFFGGLSVNETAEILKISPETVHRDWKLAKSWLRVEMSRG
jgi:RNA polymerase sigma factor (TIGR02999 family)